MRDLRKGRRQQEVDWGRVGMLEERKRGGNTTWCIIESGETRQHITTLLKGTHIHTHTHTQKKERRTAEVTSIMHQANVTRVFHKENTQNCNETATESSSRVTKRGGGAKIKRKGNTRASECI